MTTLDLFLLPVSCEKKNAFPAFLMSRVLKRAFFWNQRGNMTEKEGEKATRLLFEPNQEGDGCPPRVEAAFIALAPATASW